MFSVAFSAAIAAFFHDLSSLRERMNASKGSTSVLLGGLARVYVYRRSNATESTFAARSRLPCASPSDALSYNACANAEKNILPNRQTVHLDIVHDKLTNIKHHWYHPSYHPLHP